MTTASRVLLEADIAAERLIGIIRMSIAGLLFLGVSALLIAAQNAGLTPRMTELRLLHLGTMAYFAVGVATFVMARPDRFRWWLCWVFNFAEVLLLAFQMWVDVRDPLTPSLLGLASPLALLAAVVIAIQALRFRLDLNVGSGLLLVVTVVAILFWRPMFGQPLSPTAVEELAILYGGPPNGMRIALLAMLIGIVAATVWRSRRLVERVARETEEAENRRRFMPSELDRLDDTALAELRRGRERETVVMFVDLRGFTARTQTMGAAEAASLLSDFRRLVADAVGGTDGVIDKFIGDGALIVFGLHVELETAATQALDTAARLMASVPKASPTDAPAIAVALHAGRVIVGVIGDDRRLEFTVVGEPVNVASRLEAAAKRSDLPLLATDAFAAHLPAGDARLAPHATLTLPGLAEPVRTFAVSTDWAELVPAG